MIQICIFYDHRNRTVVERLDAGLRKYWSIWWDKQIGEGDWRKRVEAELAKDETKAVIVVWSPESRDNKLVIDEVAAAEQAGKAVFSVQVNGPELPIGHKQTRPDDLTRWNGSPADPRFQRLTEKIHAKLGNQNRAPRLWQLAVNGKTLELPSFAFSVSSHDTALQPDTALKLAQSAEPEVVLGSAFDVLNVKYGKSLAAALSYSQKTSTFVFLDSGNYEAYRLQRKPWSSNSKHFHTAYRRVKCDIAFCHDKITDRRGPKSIADEVIGLVERDRKATKTNAIAPIIHAPRRRNGDYEPDVLPEACRRVAEETRPPLLAVAERELGHGIIKRAGTVRAIREALNGLSWYQPLHLLGTGNPKSIAILAAAGGDSFDGLEWCRTVIDRTSYGLHHYQHYEFYSGQKTSIQNEFIRLALDDPSMTYPLKVALHNLGFFSEIIRDIRAKVREGTISTLLAFMLSREAHDKLRTSIPGVFN